MPCLMALMPLLPPLLLCAAASAAIFRAIDATPLRYDGALRRRLRERRDAHIDAAAADMPASRIRCFSYFAYASRHADAAMLALARRCCRHAAAAAAPPPLFFALFAIAAILLLMVISYAHHTAALLPCHCCRHAIADMLYAGADAMPLIADAPLMPDAIMLADAITLMPCFFCD